MVVYHSAYSVTLYPGIVDYNLKLNAVGGDILVGLQLLGGIRKYTWSLNLKKKKQTPKLKLTRPSLCKGKLSPPNQI